MTQLYIHTRDHRTDSRPKVYSAGMLLNAAKEVARKHRTEFYEESVKVREYAETHIAERLTQVKAEHPNFSQTAVNIEVTKQLQAECLEKTGCRPLCSQLEISTCEIMNIDEHDEAVINLEFLGRVDIPVRNSQVLEIWRKLTTNTA